MEHETQINKSLAAGLNIKVYRDGRFSRLETYGPVVKREVAGFLNKVDYWFANSGQWPHGTID